jgi:hypothetical protein
VTSAERAAEHSEAPVAHVRVVYLGPVAPHWDIESDFGDRQKVDEFAQRIQARLMFIPPHDPQFLRNRERIRRDAERERVLLEWDLGFDESELEQGHLEEEGPGHAEGT